MRYKTLGSLREEIERELDLQEESFISPDEMDGYIREAIDLSETVIIGLYEDYYLDKTGWLPVTSPIQLPTNMYASKIRKLELRNGETGNPYQITKNVHLRNKSCTSYNIYNTQGGNPYIEIEGETDATEYRLFYIRNANTPEVDSDLIDLPESSIHFVKSFVRAKCYEKEIDPRTAQAKQEVEMYRVVMVESLSNIVDDGSDFLEPDLSFYEDSYNEYY